MNKKIMITIVALVIIGALAAGYYLLTNQKEESSVENDSNQTEQSETTGNGEVAIVYFSATGNTKEVAEMIQEVTQGDLIEIVPKEEYTSEDLDYSNDDCRANQEQNDENVRPEIANQIEVSHYDTIYLGYPIWWGDVPKIILTFLDTYDLSGKTVIPFCTSGGSSIDISVNTLREYQSDVNWMDGKRFTTSTRSEIEEWIQNDYE